VLGLDHVRPYLLEHKRNLADPCEQALAFCASDFENLRDMFRAVVVSFLSILIVPVNRPKHLSLGQ
jgi:hypothetical protein